MPKRIASFGLLFALAACGHAPRLEKVWSQRGQTANEQLGYWAASGDFNTDGFSDLLVSAPGLHHCEIFSGSKNGLSKSATWRFEDPDPHAITGVCLGSAGRLDGAKVAEFYIASQRPGGLGAVHLFKPGADLAARPWISLKAPANSEGFAERVCAAGDLDGDGYDDLAVADFSYDQHRGRVYLYRGGPQGPGPKPDAWIDGEARGDWFGYSMAGHLDLDGDGVSDLVITGKNCSGACLRWMKGDPRLVQHQAYLDSLATPTAASTEILGRSGKVYILYGQKNELPRHWDRTLQGGEAEAHFGFEVIGAGDLNGDGRGDLVVSSTGWGDRRGRVEVYGGAARTAEMKPIWVSDGKEAKGEMGYWAGLAGDLDGDGLPELGAASPSLAHLFFFKRRPGGFNTGTDWTISDPPGEGFFGSVAGSAGDVDGDKRDEFFACNAWVSSGPNKNAGKIDVYKLR